LSFFIHSGERIGICGRTGAGKSSIVFALFRMAGLTSGEILVGGSNITHDVPLALLRQRMAIIPQDPVLLTGSIRFALDPFDQYTDQQVWQALETVNLSSAIKGLSNGINELVVENGNNLSHGQRQLICIARALLRDARILVVDEGTSAVDPSTDKIIQAALRNASAKYGTTVLAIAHRLQTIQDFDKILVLGDGKLLEFDSPTHLLANPKSHFAAMLQEVPMESNASVSTSAVVNA
jgi:ABC-type multidrug transport system fused ATPase/permease subunit